MEENRSQSILWAVVSSALTLGNSLRIMTEDVGNILNNTEMIAINQNRLGRAVKLISRALDGSYEEREKAIYTERDSLSGFSPAPYHFVAFLNRFNSKVDITLHLENVFDNNLDSTSPAPN